MLQYLYLCVILDKEAILKQSFRQLNLYHIF